MPNRMLKTAAPVLLVFLLTGCREIADDRLAWLWGVIPFILFGLGGGSWVAFRRRRELERWDLRAQPLPPDGSGTVIRLIVFASVLTLAFVTVDFSAAGAATSQKVTNLLWWCIVSIIAVPLALLLGRLIAERGYSQGEK